MKTQKLLELDYYIDKISLAMQSNDIFKRQITDAVAILRNYNHEIDSFKNALYLLLYDIINNDSDDIRPYEYDDLLEKIASIFNLSRDFTIDFKNPLTNEVEEDMAVNKAAWEAFNENVANGTLSLDMHLSNYQLRLLIFCAIMKNSYDGSYAMLHKYHNSDEQQTGGVYQTVINFIKAEYPQAASWRIYQMTKYEEVSGEYVATPAATDCILSYDGNYEFIDDPTDPDYESRKQLSQYFTLFFAGFLTIKSAGISYYYGVTNFEKILLWSPESGNANAKFNWSEEPYDSSNARLWL